MKDKYEQQICALHEARFTAYEQAKITRSRVWMMAPISPQCDATVLMDGTPDKAAVRLLIQMLTVFVGEEER